MKKIIKNFDIYKKDNTYDISSFIDKNTNIDSYYKKEQLQDLNKTYEKYCFKYKLFIFVSYVVWFLIFLHLLFVIVFIIITSINVNIFGKQSLYVALMNLIGVWLFIVLYFVIMFRPGKINSDPIIIPRGIFGKTIDLIFEIKNNNLLLDSEKYPEPINVLFYKKKRNNKNFHKIQLNLLLKYNLNDERIKRAIGNNIGDFYINYTFCNFLRKFSEYYLLNN